MTQFEPTDSAAAAVAGGAASAARSVLSDEFVKSGLKVAVGVAGAIADAVKPADSSNPAVKAGEAIGQGVAEAIGKDKPSGPNDSSPPSELGKLAAELLKNGIENGDKKITIGDGMNDIVRSWDNTVTDKNRNEAKEALAKNLSGLIPEADRALLKTMQGALIDGNLDKLKASLGSLSGNPDRMDAFIKEINANLKREGSTVELTNDGKGNVLVYDQWGNTAVSINAKTGETTLRAIERQNDGSILLKPGEIINRKPAEVMKNLGDEATRSITGMNHRFYKYQYLDHIQGRSGGGGGGGGDYGGKIVPNSKFDNYMPELKKKQN